MKYIFIPIWVLVLGISLLAPTITTEKVGAISNNLVIYQLQTGSIDSASEEIILLYNSSDNEVNITNWCVFYSSASNLTVRKLACVDAPAQTEIWLESKGVVSFATSEFTTANPGFVADYLFSSGMASVGGHVWIEDNSNIVVDRLGWGTASLPEVFAVSPHSSGKVLSRNLGSLVIDTDNNISDFNSQLLMTPIVSGLYEKAVVIDVCPNIIDIQINLPIGFLPDDIGDCYLDICPNIDDLQVTVPDGYEKVLSSSECTEIKLENAAILITELMPNVTSVDTGKEFIELYNPNTFEVNLAGYSIQLGPTFTKKFVIQNVVLAPGQYRVFYDSQSSIVLPNTSGAELRLVAPAGNIVAETAVYNNAPDDLSWALVEDQWIFTNQPTPNSSNQPYIELAVDEEINITTVLGPCPIGKYRNPETNRCRNIETAVSSLTSCDEDEYRNPETNRCRKLTSTSGSLVACKAGQVRNPETNRCRNTVANSSLVACKEGQERNPETNRCRKVNVLGASTDDIPKVTDIAVNSTSGGMNWPVIAAVVIATVSYMFYEWRSELRHFYSRTRTKLVQ